MTESLDFLAEDLTERKAQQTDVVALMKADAHALAETLKARGKVAPYELLPAESYEEPVARKCLLGMLGLTKLRPELRVWIVRVSEPYVQQGALEYANHGLPEFEPTYRRSGIALDADGQLWGFYDAPSAEPGELELPITRSGLASDDHLLAVSEVDAHVQDPAAQPALQTWRQELEQVVHRQIFDQRVA